MNTGSKDIRLFALRLTPHGGSAHVAQSVEHVLGKDEVTSSILVVGSSEGIVMGYEL
jgi:hypothetical protein